MKAVERGSGDEGNMLGNLDSKEEARENDKGYDLIRYCDCITA